MTKSHPEGYMTAEQVRQRFRISDMTLWRWVKDPDMTFPQPTTIRRRRYFATAEVEAWVSASGEQPRLAVPEPADEGSSVVIRLPRDIAERISNGLSDIALWCHGFNAALSPDDHARRPWGTDAVTDINLRLKNALATGESDV